MGMFDTFRHDLQHFAGPSARAARALLSFGPQALAVYRLGRWIEASHPGVARRAAAMALRPVYAALSRYVRFAYDIDLDLSADIGRGLKVFHFAGIRLSGCKVGEHCVIHQEVRLEPATRGGRGPVVGRNVWIGPRARIVGPVRVGDGATVAAGALVTADVPARALTVGSPARTASINYDNGPLL